MWEQLMIELKVLWNLAWILGPILFWLIVGFAAFIIYKKGGYMWGMKSWWE